MLVEGSTQWPEFTGYEGIFIVLIMLRWALLIEYKCSALWLEV